MGSECVRMSGLGCGVGCGVRKCLGWGVEICVVGVCPRVCILEDLCLWCGDVGFGSVVCEVCGLGACRGVGGG